MLNSKVNNIKYILVLLIYLGVVFKAGAQGKYIFRDVSQPVDVRVKDLIGRLTLDEKIAQLMNNTPAIPRLNIPAYDWWNEGLHGVARAGVATVFPQAIGLAATFDDQLAFQESTAISDEARAMYNATVANGYHLQYAGLTFWTPNINIFRDPRWGRGQETYGEDPYLTGTMGTNFIKGLQGNDSLHLKVAACAKHFAVHSGPERLRHVFNAEVSIQDLRETYLPAFKALVTNGVEAVMCAYNSTNGQPCCGNNFLIDTVLRKEWGFKGHVVSDCGALDDFYEGHKVVANSAQAAALALKTGVNLNCGTTYLSLADAVKQHLVPEKEIDSTLAVLMRTRFKLGLFDPAGTNPYDTLSAGVINSPGHRALAKKVALESMVLLKNDGVLPLKNNLSKYYVTGPNASNVDVLLGNYYGVNDHMSTFLEGLASAIKPGSQLQYKMGVLFDRPNNNPIDWTTDDAKSADVIIVVMGISGLLEGEEGESIASSNYGDRIDYNIPQNQIDFLKKLRAGNSKPIVAIVTGGSPMNLAEVHQLANAVILTWYPGEEGGNALADLVFGKVSPSGKLPVTFPMSLDQLPAYDNYAMKGRTYRYMTAKPMYPFGYGLSYSSFKYSNVSLSANSAGKTDTITAEATITNNGKMKSDEVVQLYISVKGGMVSNAPLYSLKSFKRVSIEPGKSVRVKFNITPQMRCIYNENGELVAEKGPVNIFIAGAAPIERSTELGIDKPLMATVTIK
jgi:beta-glucosidase